MTIRYRRMGMAFWVGCAPIFFGCVSNLDDPSPLKAIADTEITDPVLIRQAKTKAEQTRMQFQQQTAPPEHPETDMGTESESSIQTPVRRIDSSKENNETAPRSPDLNINISGLPLLEGVRILGTIAAPGATTKALVKRANEESVICKVGDSILVDSGSYQIKTITSSGDVVVEANDGTQFVIQ